ncbi:MAG: NAD+ synthase [Gammaproteobacteria bacterium]|nr:NAD+ synthase [Gammaproteobacteria bacterium]MCF6230905.1 NAD+ synthase [Gammaproteobacteria bacterium]
MAGQSNNLRIVMGQLNMLVGDVEGNVTQLVDAAVRARDELDADVILFPELALTGYPPEDLLLRAGLYQRINLGLKRLQQQMIGITAIVGYPQQLNGHTYNALSAIAEGAILATTYKRFLPNYGVFDEKRYFDSTTKPPATLEVNGFKLALLICEDMWHVEPAAEAVAQGAELLLVANASPYHVAKGEERIKVARQRARETASPIVYTNLIGGQDELVFDGGSFVVDAQGDLQQQVPFFEEGLFVAEFFRSNDGITTQRGISQPTFREERNIYRALVLGVRDYIDKNGFSGAVLGLSGGIDSALTLAIAVDAIGADRVEAVMMPSRYTADMSLEDAAEEAVTLGVDYRVITIEPLYDAFMCSLADEFSGLPADTTEENLQARCRGVLLMAISNKKGKIVLTTGNKSEMAVGYATLYGDMAGGFAVLKDVPKMLVYRLSEYRNALSKVIPQRVIDRPPSAELAPDQKDQDSLPPYNILDAILARYVEQEQCIEEIIAAGFEEKTVKRVVRLVDLNEYKRRQAAPGVRVTQRAFGRDRRYPITSAYNRRQR